MKLELLTFSPVLSVRFSPGEIEALSRCAFHHYDGTCRRTTQTGGLLWPAIHFPEHAHGYTFRDLDLLCKVMECSAHLPDVDRLFCIGLSERLRAALKFINENTPQPLILS